MLRLFWANHYPSLKKCKEKQFLIFIIQLRMKNFLLLLKYDIFEQNYNDKKDDLDR